MSSHRSLACKRTVPWPITTQSRSVRQRIMHPLCSERKFQHRHNGSLWPFRRLVVSLILPSSSFLDGSQESLYSAALHEAHGSDVKQSFTSKQTESIYQKDFTNKGFWDGLQHCCLGKSPSYSPNNGAKTSTADRQVLEQFLIFTFYKSLGLFV